MSESTKAQKALDYYMSGFNCAQSVFAAFHEELGLSEDFALRLSSSFGAGMGGLRETCGTFSGMCMVLGGMQGYDVNDDLAAKQQQYARVKTLAALFTDQFGTLNCRELLKRNGIIAKPEPSERNAEYYAKRPCGRYVYYAAGLIEEELKRG